MKLKYLFFIQNKKTLLGIVRNYRNLNFYFENLEIQLK